MALEHPGRPTIQVTATPCRHGPPGSRPIVGDVIGFSLRWDGQRHGTVWISGDTVLYGGLREVARRVDVGTALVHLGGVRFPITGPIRYTMRARHVAAVCDLLQPHTTIPVHYEGWSHFREGRLGRADRAGASRPGGPLLVALDPARCRRRGGAVTVFDHGRVHVELELVGDSDCA